MLTLNGPTIFKGFESLRPKHGQPKYIIGEGPNFINGSTDEKDKVMTVLKKHAYGIFEWLEKYRPFTNYAAEIPTTGHCVLVPPFRMNKPKRDTMELVLQKYLDRKIREPS
jgi:hypothetical protein